MCVCVFVFVLACALVRDAKFQDLQQQLEDTMNELEALKSLKLRRFASSYRSLSLSCLCVECVCVRTCVFVCVRACVFVCFTSCA